MVGTPADCTQAGLSLLGKNIDLVILGINRGLNCGTDILYSGTVSAAIEGAIYNVPSIAISMEADWFKAIYSVLFLLLIKDSLFLSI